MKNDKSNFLTDTRNIFATRQRTYRHMIFNVFFGALIYWFLVGNIIEAVIVSSIVFGCWALLGFYLGHKYPKSETRGKE